ncbi:MAG: hypothetical protein JWM40_1728 [Frankiales bacterium]|nr:hypothetical protein [Frankiales bacterium]
MPALPPVLARKSVAIPLAVAVVLGLGVGGFLGYGAYTRSKPVDYSRGGHDFAAAPPASSTPQPLTATTAAPSASASASAAPSRSSSATAAPIVVGPSTQAPTAVATAPRATAGPTKAVVAVPRVGVYKLAVSGSEKVKFGVVSFCNQALPKTSDLVVSKAAGESATSYDFDLRYFPGQTGQHDERHIYRYTPTSTFMDYEIATVTCQGVRQSSETSYGTPQLRAKLPLTVGQSWSNSGGGSERTEKGTWKVERQETLTIAGVKVPTWVITDTVALSGNETGDRTQTWWYSPTWAMPVKWIEQIHGSRSGASYSENVTVSVLSRP